MRYVRRVLGAVRQAFMLGDHSEDLEGIGDGLMTDSKRVDVH